MTDTYELMETYEKSIERLLNTPADCMFYDSMAWLGS